MKNLTTLLVSSLLLATAASQKPLCAQAAVPPQRIQLQAGKASSEVTGKLQGRQDADYLVSGKAGQTISVKLKTTNSSCFFNVLPPGSKDVAMYNGSVSGNSFSSLLPSDGDYIVRVYLMRNAGRRGENTKFTLSMGMTGKPLSPLPGATDAKVKGTPYHATAEAKCSFSIFPDIKKCKAGVIRRGSDGTATVDFAWSNGGKRSVLFVKGAPVSSDSAEKLTFERKKNGIFVIKLGGDSEQFEIADALLLGG